MHNIATSKIECANLVANKATVAAPYHMSERGINQKNPNGNKSYKSAKLHTPSKRATNNCSSNAGKCGLECNIDDCGIRRITGIDRLSKHVGHSAHASQLVKPTEKRIRPIATICQTPSCQDPYDCHHPNNHERHEHGVDDVFTTRKSAVKKCNAWSHKKDQHCTYQHECGCSCVKHCAYLLNLLLTSTFSTRRSLHSKHVQKTSYAFVNDDGKAS